MKIEKAAAKGEGDGAAGGYLRWSRGGAAGGVGSVAMVAEARWPAVFSSPSSSVFFFFCFCFFFSSFSSLFPLPSAVFSFSLVPFYFFSLFFSLVLPCFYRQKQGRRHGGGRRPLHYRSMDKNEEASG